MGLKNENISLKGDIKRLKDELESKERIIKQLQAEMRNDKKDLHAIRESYQVFIKMSRKSRENMRSKISNLERQIQTLETSLMRYCDLLQDTNVLLQLKESQVSLQKEPASFLELNKNEKADTTEDKHGNFLQL